MGPDSPLVDLKNFSLSRREGDGERVLLQDIDLEIRPGSWIAVLGPNGAGKSSLLRYLAGDESPVADHVSIMFQDPDDQLVAATLDAELGLGDPGRDVAALRQEYGLGAGGGLPPRLLSAGQKQRLVLAVSLAQRPDLLLCDEPSALQDREQATWVLDRLDAWRRTSGGALVTATCDRSEAARADELVVLREGRIHARGTPAELLDASVVRELLDPPPARSVVTPATDAPPVVSCEGLVWRFGDSDKGLGPFDLEVCAGERVGLTGPNGCGKSTLLAACAGLRRPDGGRIRVGNRPLYASGARDLDHGLALLAPQFPEYMFTSATVSQEIALDPSLAPDGPSRLLADLGLTDDLLERNPHSLSTGQRRRLALGLVLGSDRPLLLLDEPGAALDRDGRMRVLAMLEKVPPTAALVIASHDPDFLAAAGCRRVDLSARV